MDNPNFLKKLEYRVREETTAFAPIIGPFVRLKKSLSATLPLIWRSIVWSFRSKEFTNFSYSLTERNLDTLSDSLAQSLGGRALEHRIHIDELENDKNFRSQLGDVVRSTKWKRVVDLPVRYGRRAGWYAVARALKPRCIVEVGVENGIGASVLARALQRNEEEGHRGKFIGIDRWKNAGWMLPADQAQRAVIVRDEASQIVKHLDDKIDLLVYDAWPGFEGEFYKMIAPHLANDAVILTDDGHVNDALRRFAHSRQLAYHDFHEQAADHWYSCGGIGFAYPPQ